MKKLVLLTFALFMVGSLPAMMQQQQQKQKQEQEQEQKERRKKRQKDNHDKTNPSGDPIADPDVALLQEMLSNIVHRINQEHGSVTNMVETLKHKDHQRICPTCGRPAEVCETDRDRIAHGNVMLCGCAICGGLLV